MAKKKKGARPSASRGARKKAASRPTRRKTAAKRPRASTRQLSATGGWLGLENPNQVNLTPLKAHLRAHIERLENVSDPSPQIRETLDILRKARQELSSPCGLSMVIATTTV